LTGAAWKKKKKKQINKLEYIDVFILNIIFSEKTKTKKNNMFCIDYFFQQIFSVCTAPQIQVDT